MAKRVSVISIRLNNRKHYLEHEEAGTIDLSTNTKKKGMGYFSSDLKDAKKFLNKLHAEIVASGYSGAHVETIKEGEVLK